MKTPHRTRSTAFRSTFIAAAFVTTVFAIGCSDSGISNPIASESPTMATIARASELQFYSLDGTDNLVKGGNDNYCETHQIGYVQFQNQLRCEAVIIEVDGYLFTELEPNTGVSAYLPSGEHLLSFKSVKTGKAIRELGVMLRTCSDMTFSTGTDMCAHAAK
ncbi:MAG: hypothetical protein IPP40_04505 [bacterium]|nr:hypothetical protein [bacterium]